ncbi:MAG: XRE family transcriptional regulator [Escherichia coli]|nr:XRE family transcriptional regulator [Escherichia coli]
MENLARFLSTTLKQLRQQRGWSLSRLAEATGVSKAQQHAMVITSLFPYDPQLCFEHFSIQMASGAISESTPHEKGVIEHVVVIDGQLDLCVDGEWQTLNCGEGVRFAADVTHIYRNGGEQTVHFHSLIH